MLLGGRVLEWSTVARLDGRERAGLEHDGEAGRAGVGWIETRRRGWTRVRVLDWNTVALLIGGRVLEWNTVARLDGRESAGLEHDGEAGRAGECWIVTLWRCWTGGRVLEWNTVARLMGGKVLDWNTVARLDGRESAGWEHVGEADGWERAGLEHEGEAGRTEECWSGTRWRC